MDLILDLIDVIISSIYDPEGFLEKSSFPNFLRDRQTKSIRSIWSTGPKTQELGQSGTKNAEVRAKKHDYDY